MFIIAICFKNMPKRTEFGTLPLDEDLEEGEYRELTDEELAILKSF